MSLKRAVIAAAILLLAVPSMASAGGASDSPGTDGVLIDGWKPSPLSAAWIRPVR